LSLCPRVGQTTRAGWSGSSVNTRASMPARAEPAPTRSVGHSAPTSDLTCRLRTAIHDTHNSDLTRNSCIESDSPCHVKSAKVRHTRGVDRRERVGLRWRRPPRAWWASAGLQRPGTGSGVGYACLPIQPSGQATVGSSGSREHQRRRSVYESRAGEERVLRGLRCCLRRVLGHRAEPAQTRARNAAAPCDPRGSALRQILSVRPAAATSPAERHPPQWPSELEVGDQVLACLHPSSGQKLTAPPPSNPATHCFRTSRAFRAAGRLHPAAGQSARTTVRAGLYIRRVRSHLCAGRPVADRVESEPASRRATTSPRRPPPTEVRTSRR